MSLTKVVDQIKLAIKEQVNNIHTCLPGEIVSVDKRKGLVEVQPKAQMTFSNGKTLDFPIIAGVPLVFPQGGDASITFPVKEGDQCLIVFSEQPLDYWFGEGEASPNVKHGLSGAIAIPGLMKEISDDFALALEKNEMIIRNGVSVVELSDKKITVSQNNTEIVVNKEGIAVRGDITVEGNLTINGTLTNDTDEITGS